jgi:DNA-binding response OmpR family regulator
MSRRILIVEDSDDVRESYARWFAAADFEVVEARDGNEAQAQSRKKVPDVVLLDISLPDTDGYTLAERWQRDPRMAGVPVVVLSGRTGEDHERRSFRSGALIALTKPCMPEMILAAIKGALPA